MQFVNRTVLITGAAAGIGRSAAEKFAAEGARLVVVDRSLEGLAGLAAPSETVTAVELDITNSAGIEALAARVGRVDVLFNCAGVVTGGTVLETSREEWDQTFGVNVTAMFEMTRAFLPAMVENGSGCIINMASVVSSLKGLPNRFAYGASKAAVIGLTKSVAADFVAKGIRCNAICPGTVDTPSLQQRMHATGDYEGARLAFLSRQPMGRLAHPGEIADLVLFLASDSASFMTGQTVTIDGGISI
jgi:2-keto-3-deoxy-L-fuconate dehydrogenase